MHHHGVLTALPDDLGISLLTVVSLNGRPEGRKSE